MSAAPEAGWRRLLRRLGIDLRDGETAGALLLFAAFFLVTAFQITTKTVRQSAFVDTLGADRLPLVYLLVAIASYPFLRLHNFLSDRLDVRRLMALSSVGVGAGLVLFWLLFRYPWTWVPVLFYVLASAVYAMLITQFWSLANQSLDPRQARRLFGTIGAGGLLGGIAGGQIARLSSELVGTAFSLLVAAGLLALLAALLVGAPRLGLPAPAGGRGPDKLARAEGGFEAVRGSAQLRWVALLMVVSVIAAQLVDLQFNAAVERATTGLDERTAFFGNFFSLLGVLAFVFQLTVTARIHRYLGVGFALQVLPVAIGLGTAALFLAAGLFPAWVVWAALALKAGDSGLRYSLDQATRELLFLPVPARLRLKAKAFIDVFLQRGGKGLAALLLLPVTFGWMTAVDVGWMTLALVAVWLWAGARVYREYVRSFRRGLEHRTVDATIPINLSDPATLELLMQSLGSSDRRQVLHALEVLSSQGRGSLVPPLLLYHDDADVRRKTLEVLAAAGRLDAASLIERRLADEDPDVRAEAIRVLAQLHGRDVCELMLPRLEEGDPGVRAAAVACLATHGDEGMVERASEVLGELLTDAEPAVRAEAAKAIGAIHEPRFRERLVTLLYDREPVVVKAAIAAVRRRVARDGYNPLYVATLVSLLQDRRVKHEARAALIAFGEEVVPVLTHFLRDADEPIWVRRALPRTLERIGSPAAAAALLESLETAADLFIRRELIDALRECRETLQPDAERRAAVERQLRLEAGSYLRALARLAGLGGLGRARLFGPRIVWKEEVAPSLLERLLAERADEHLRNLFSLLALLHDARDVAAAYRAVTGDRPAARAHALEYLDHLLEGDARRAVLTAVDDRVAADKLRDARRLFDVAVGTPVATLEALLGGAERDEGGGGALALAALYTVHTDRVSDLYPQVEHLASEAGEPFVRETAEWVIRRLDAVV